MAAARAKSQPWTKEFTVTHLKKVDDVVHFGGTHNQDPFEWVSYDGFNNRAKGEIKRIVEANGISYDRYKNYGGDAEVVIETMLNSSAGDLFRISLPDPDAVSILNLDNTAQGMINYALQIDYRIASTFEPLASTKIMKCAPNAIVINSGIPIPDVLKKIAKVKYKQDAEDEFYKAVGKVTYFRIFTHVNAHHHVYSNRSMLFLIIHGTEEMQ